MGFENPFSGGNPGRTIPGAERQFYAMMCSALRSPVLTKKTEIFSKCNRFALKRYS